MIGTFRWFDRQHRMPAWYAKYVLRYYAVNGAKGIYKSLRDTCCTASGKLKKKSSFFLWNQASANQN